MNIYTEIQELMAILDMQEYPETYECLAELALNDEDDIPDLYEIATSLRLCDAAIPMSQSVFDFIVELYEELIADGNDDAMNDLGALYYDGRGCEQNFKKAVEYYHMAAVHGNRTAQENLGYCYYYGRDIEQDYEKAFHYFALGAFDGYAISLYKIGDMYQNGYYVQKNPEEAFRIYNRCLEIMTDDDAESVAGPVFLRLGNCFLRGNGTEENAMNALVCFQKAELYLYDMVKKGERMYKKSLQAAIDGQLAARKKLDGELPGVTWLDGNKD